MKNAPILPDVLAPGLRVVFCGSAAGAVSAKLGAYYAGPGNRFWPTLHAVGLTPRLVEPAEFHTLPAYGLGLTDMAKHASGADAALPRGSDDPGGVRRRVLAARPRILAFVGKRAATVFLRAEFGLRTVPYGEQAATLDGIRIFVLPSPSGLAVRYWDLGPWRALARATRDADDAPPRKKGKT
jgi:TDG/mug DNA glycosylase family protein